MREDENATPEPHGIADDVDKNYSFAGAGRKDEDDVISAGIIGPMDVLGSRDLVRAQHRGLIFRDLKCSFETVLPAKLNSFGKPARLISRGLRRF